ncbi:MAG: cation transporter [Verrucomicrobia bacterium]|nr:cation transporter [Verrucomicrobiota bacterium]NBU09674.1 cation transporter [Pseudomonadota bacterium]NDA67366.1 cation transporter [Verrucomicrobiota bacterium]NDB76182.1 cation transporter [Verrucomicrobiota bacterium]NDD39243.1 cation transporter [Verrucomicrobiota bacterium]
MSDHRLHRSLRATFLGMAVNTVLSVGKMTAGFIGHSHALIADGVESLADIFSSVIVWRGMVIASEPADADHPYGHGKAEPLAAAMVAIMLLLAALWIAIHSLQEVLNPHELPAPWTLPLLLIVIVVKETLFRFAFHEGTAIESTVVQSDAWHHRADAITSLCAAVGITIALVGGPRFAAADDVAALIASGIIAWNGWRLLRPAFGELMDAAPNLAEAEEIRLIAVGVAEVRFVEKCLIRKMGWHLYVDMHVHVDPQMSVERAHRIAHEVKDRVRARLPKVRDVLVHIEPGHTD